MNSSVTPCGGTKSVVANPWDNVLVILDGSKGPLRMDEQKRVIERPDAIP